MAQAARVTHVGVRQVSQRPPRMRSTDDPTTHHSLGVEAGTPWQQERAALMGKCVSVMAAHWRVVGGGRIQRPVLLQRPRVGRLCGALIQLRGRGPGPCAGGTARFSAARLVQLGAVTVGIITQGAILWRGSGKLRSCKGPFCLIWAPFKILVLEIEI